MPARNFLEMVDKQKVDGRASKGTNHRYSLGKYFFRNLVEDLTILKCTRLPFISIANNIFYIRFCFRS